MQKEKSCVIPYKPTPTEMIDYTDCMDFTEDDLQYIESLNQEGE